MTQHIDAGNCPTCGHRMTGHHDLAGNSKPLPGYAAVCFYCEALLVFDENLKVRLATQSEIGNDHLLGVAIIRRAKYQQALRQKHFNN